MLSPADIQNQEFKRSKIGGYNIEEVNEFLEEVSNNYQESVNENYALKDKISALNESIQYYRSMESTIQNVLVLADKTAQDTKEAASSEAEKILEEAKLNSSRAIDIANAKAEKMINSAKDQVAKIVNDGKKDALELSQKVEDIKRQYLSYKAQFKQLLQSQTELLEQGDAYTTIAQVDESSAVTNIESDTVDDIIKTNYENINNASNEELQFTREYTPVTEDEMESLLSKAE